jgi:TPR repeat protein
VKTFYQILEVSEKSTNTEIKEAYRRLCKQFHPDINKTEAATKRMQEINGAYAVLSNEEKRTEYDKLLELRRNNVQQPQSHGGEASSHEPCCEKCGVQDATLRVAVFTWIISIVILSFKRHWAKVLCSKCRIKYGLLFDLQVATMGWWAFPWGFFWTIEALANNSAGGKQPEPHNALLLRSVGYKLYLRGEYAEALKALKASLKFQPDPEVEKLLLHVIEKIKGSPEEKKPKTPDIHSWYRRVFAIKLQKIIQILENIGNRNIANTRFSNRKIFVVLNVLVLCVALLFLFLQSGKNPSNSVTKTKKSIQEIRRTAESGDAKAQFDLCLAYQFGSEVQQSNTDAHYWYSKCYKKLLKLAQSGDAEAQYQMFYGALLYSKEPFDPKVGKVLDEWLKKSAAQHYPDAVLSLALGYLDDVGNKEATEADKSTEADKITEADKLLSEYARDGNSEKQVIVGNLYLWSFRNSSTHSKDYLDKAARWMRLAADQDNHDGQAFLGVILLGQGLRSYKLPEDNIPDELKANKQKEAFTYLFKASEHNNLLAEIALARAYKNGDGVSKDSVEAVKWYTKVVQHRQHRSDYFTNSDMSEAQFELGKAYATGIGTPQNLTEAYKWLNLVTPEGSNFYYKEAAILRDQVASQMTADQITEAERQSASFNSSNAN